jgi:hypothetical protein
MVTEMTFATSAPPASETTVATTVGVIPASETCTGRQQHRADLRAVAQLQDSGDQVHHDHEEQLDDAVMIRVLQLAYEEAEVQRQGEDDEEPEDDLFTIHGPAPCCGTHRPPVWTDDDKRLAPAMAVWRTLFFDASNLNVSC